MAVQFKTTREQQEHEDAPQALRFVAHEFIKLSNEAGIIPVVTRLLRPVAGESGVHLDYRAIDFRDEMGVGGVRLYTHDLAEEIVKKMNSKFTRRDKYLVCIHHAFVSHASTNSSRAPYHFHIQIPQYAKNEIPDEWLVNA